jgi:hypothetical protein
LRNGNGVAYYGAASGRIEGVCRLEMLTAGEELSWTRLLIIFPQMRWS